MRCYYEVLEVDQICSSADIKSAYRRLALKCHPDKNDNSEEAKEEFQAIQEAYSILSNPDERCFYDRNKENLMQKGGDVCDESIDITMCILVHFPSSCFKGFDDAEKGFFTVYRLAFETIMKQEIEVRKRYEEIPSFGKSTTDPKEVAMFYDHWLNYSTEMHFAWADIHTLNADTNRRAERFMVQENKKKRDVARKKFTAYVRSFVQLVKKRDPRMKVYQKERQEEMARKREETLQKQEQMRKRRIERNQQLYKKTVENSTTDKLYEEKLRHLEMQLENGCSSESSSEEGEGSDETTTSKELFCVVCEKVFKTENAFVNHEKSKKHMDKLEKLKEIIKEDDDILVNTPDSCDSKDEELMEEEVLVNEEPLINESSSKSQRRKKNKKSKQAFAQIYDDDLLDEMADINISNTKETDEKPQNTAPLDKKAKKPRRRAKKNEEVVQQEDKFACKVCGKEFPGKNKLFKHIQAEGHAALR